MPTKAIPWITSVEIPDSLSVNPLSPFFVDGAVAEVASRLGQSHRPVRTETSIHLIYTACIQPVKGSIDTLIILRYAPSSVTSQGAQMPLVIALAPSRTA